jgi:hypothetical protein
MIALDRLARHLNQHPDQRAAVDALFELITPETLALVDAAIRETDHEHVALARIESILAG